MENVSEQPDKTTALALAYEKDYEIDDEAFVEPFVVLKLVARESFAWWNGNKGRRKVERLIEGFKTDLKTEECMVFAGISRTQYYYFCEIHPLFYNLKQRLKTVMAISAKRGLVKDVTNPEGFRTRQWYLEKRQPEIYGRDISAYQNLPPAGATAKISAEAFLDKDGNMLVSKQTAELLNKKHGDEDDTERQNT